MISQYETTSSLPSVVIDYVCSHIGIFDKYVGFYTSQNSIDFVVTPAYGDSYSLHFTRDGSYSSSWSVSKSSSDFSYTVYNPLYCYDNIGVGHELTSVHKDNMLFCAILFLILIVLLFKGGLTKWLRK